MDDEGVVCVGPQLADHHLGGLEADLAGREEHVGATGQAELRARVQARSRVISGHGPALEHTSARLDFRAHDALVRLHPQAAVLSLELGDAAIVRRRWRSASTPGPRLADETLQAVAGVTTPPKAARGGPLQNHRGLIHHRDELLWR